MRLSYLKIRNIAENLFICGWVLMVIHMCISYSALSAYSNSLVSVIGFFLFLAKLIDTKYTVRELLIGIFIIFVGFMVLFKTQDMRVFWFGVVIISAKNVDMEKIICVTYYVTIVCCILFFLAYLLGISEDTIIYLGDGTARHGFGFGHPNTLQAYILYIVIMTIYLNYENIRMRTLVLLAIFTYFVYRFTYSRTGLVVSVLVLITASVVRFFSIRKFNNRVVTLVGGIYIIVFSLLPIIYNRYLNIIFYAINDVFSGRISQAAYFYKAYGIKLFGSYLIELSYEQKYIFLDMGYAKILFNDGLIYFLLVVGGSMWLLNKYAKEMSYKRTFLLISFIFFMGTENVATYIFMNVSMLLISELIFKEKRKSKL